MQVCHDFFWLLESGFTFPEVDPDPAKWNTAKKSTK